MHLTPLESKFVLVAFDTWTNTTQPKACKWLMEDLYPHQTFYSVMLEIAMVELWFWIYDVVAIVFA